MFSTVRSKILLGLVGVTLLLGGAYLYVTQSKTWQWNLPAHFPAPRVPPDNLMSEAKFQLGRSLFYDKRLSGNGTMACASCHFQHLAFTDGKALSIGSTGMHTSRSAQGLANSAYHPYLTWANYSLVTLERQMLNPLLGENPVEMGVNDGTMPVILQRLRDDEKYAQQFKQVFPDEENPFTLANCVKAIATFQRGLMSANSKYDQFLQHKVMLSDSETRGKMLFFSEKAQCSQCHSGFNFTDQTVTAANENVPTPFHNTGLYNIDGKGGFPEGNRGIFELSNKPADMGAFRAPSLRNVAVTAPYMHDGSIQNLSQVLDFYAGHGRVMTQGEYQGDGRLNPFKDARINRIDLSAQDKADLIAFLNTLTDTDFLRNPRFSDPFGAPHAAQ